MVKNTVVPKTVVASSLEQAKSGVFLHVDHEHMGLGGDVSWFPSALPHHYVPDKARYVYHVILRPLRTTA